MKFQIGVCVTIVILTIAFAVKKAMDPSRREPPPPPPASWAKLPPDEWPQIVLTHEAELRRGRDLSGASACLIALPDGNVFGATAKQITGGAGVHSSALNNSIQNWVLHPPTAPEESIQVASVLFMKKAVSETIALEIAPPKGKLPVKPLQLRATPVIVGERVFIVGVPNTESNVRQKVYGGIVTAPFFGGIDGSLDQPLNLDGLSGAPIVDTNGLLVAIMTRTKAEPDRHGRSDSFTGRAVGELRLILESQRVQWRKRPQPQLASSL